MKTKKLFVNQYGEKIYASTIKELRSKVDNGGSKVSKMYSDKKDGVYHVGYVIGRHWFTMYQPITIKV